MLVDFLRIFLATHLVPCYSTDMVIEENYSHESQYNLFDRGNLFLHFCETESLPFTNFMMNE